MNDSIAYKLVRSLPGGFKLIIIRLFVILADSRGVRLDERPALLIIQTPQEIGIKEVLA